MIWLRRLCNTFIRRRVDRTIDEDIRFHIDERADDYIRQGMDAQLARREAIRRFGSSAMASERARDAETLRWLADAAHDARYAIRTLRMNPGFASAALLTLALGIGLTTAVFSVVYGVILRPLPYPAADRLVRVWEEHPGGGSSVGGNRWISNRTYSAWVERPRAIDVLGAYGTFEDTVTLGGEDVRLSGAQVSPPLLSALGAKPIIGRLFTSEEAEEGAPDVALLSEALWRGRLAADPGIVGRSLVLDRAAHTIVGVIASDFSFPDRSRQIWTPRRVERVSSDPARSQRTSGLTALARLAPGATVAQVEAEGTLAARSVPVTMATRALFGTGGPPIVHARPLATDMAVDVRPVLLLVAAAVGCVLLMACANVANLFLSRGVARQREFAVRVAIGAGAGRLARQLLTESAVLAAGGGSLGFLLARTVVALMPLLAPAGFPRLAEVRIDGHVMAFALVATLVTALLSGVIPALRGARVTLAGSLRGGDGGASGGFRGVRARHVRNGLLIAESMLAVMLLVGAVLLSRSFLRLTTVDTGYSPERVLTASVLMARQANPQRAGQVADQVLARLRGTPGITAAGAGNMMPLSGAFSVSTFTIPDRSGSQVVARALAYTVTPGYAEALGLRLREGRFFDSTDGVPGRRAMIVNDLFVNQYLNAPAVGHRFVNLFRNDNNTITEIVGVVGAVRKEGNDRAPIPEIYFPHGSPGYRFQGYLNLVVRTSGDPNALTGTMRQILREYDADAIIDRVEPLANPLWVSVAQPRFTAAVLVTFALVALAIASIGLYGVVSYAVSQRRREFGVRAALGAPRGAILRMVLREGITVTGAGAVLGLSGATVFTRLMQSALFGVTPLDAVSFIAAPVALLPVAVLACLIPAVRAAATDPADALRAE